MRTGIRNIKGGKSRQDDTGRDCLLYFYWQGKDCTVADKGTAALMMSEIDSDEGPQVNNLISLSNVPKLGQARLVILKKWPNKTCPAKYSSP